MKQRFHVTLLAHKAGVSVSCPELPGCHSQGATVEEALDNIRDAIKGYLGKPQEYLYTIWRRARLVFLGILKEIVASPLGNNVSVCRAGSKAPLGGTGLR